MVDIVKTYLQIAVSPTEHGYVRFLWYDSVMKEDQEFVQILFYTSHLCCNLFAISSKWYRKENAEIDLNFTTKMLGEFYKDD